MFPFPRVETRAELDTDVALEGGLEASIPITTKRLQIQPILRLFLMVTQKQPSREAIVQRD